MYACILLSSSRMFASKTYTASSLCIELAPKVSVASDDFLSEPAWLVHFRFYCEASVFWLFAALNLSQQTLEVGVYHVRRIHLFVKVFESHLVLSVLGQLCSC